MNTALKRAFKKIILKYIVFMAPAMLIAAKGFADLWLSGREQPYIALTLLVLAAVSALMLLTMASAFLYLSQQQSWIPPGKLILLTTGMKLYFDVSLGTTVGLLGMAASLGLWGVWGFLAYRHSRRQLERS